MKRIYQGHDIAFNLTLNYFPIDIAHVDNIEFTFYTTNSKDGIKKNKSNVSDGSLIIQWFELAKLAEGVLYYDYKVNNNALDTVTNVMTDFYIMSGVKDINIETKEVDWGNIKGTITNQVDLIDYVKHKVETGDSKKVDKVSGKSLIEDSEIARLKTLKNYDDSTVKADIKKLESYKLDKSEAQTKYQPKGNYLIEHQNLDHKVDKVDGKSLVSDKEILRLSKVTNYDDKKVKSDIEYLKSNKANQSYVDSEIGLLATKDELSNKADVSIIPQRLSQLDNDVNYVQDGAYVHTDNNFGNADKDKLDQLHNYNDSQIKKDIQDLKDRPTTPDGGYLRVLYERVGAKFNHDTGYYELNGFTDITEKEMSDIFYAGKWWETNGIGVLSGTKSRTNIGTTRQSQFMYNTYSFQQAFNESSLVKVVLTEISRPIKISNMSFTGQGSSKLKQIVGIIDCTNLDMRAYLNPPTLEEVMIKGLKKDIIITSPYISLNSLLFLIHNSTATSDKPITISLDNSAYLKFKDDSQIKKEMDLKNGISLASMN